MAPLALVLAAAQAVLLPRLLVAAQTVTTLAGGAQEGTLSGALDGGALTALFNDPRGVTAASGVVYVADTLNNRVCAVLPNQTSATLAGGGASGSQPGFGDGVGSAALFQMPTGIAADASGAVFVADTANHRLRVIFANRSVATVAGGGSLGSADGVGTAAQFNSPSGIALGAAGALFVADSGNNKIRLVFPANRTVFTFAGSGAAGSANGVGALALFNGPAGVGVAASGLVYVADTLNNKVRVIFANRSVANLAGGGSGGTSAGAVDGIGSSGLFDQPLSVTVVESLGTVIVADTNNNKIRAIHPANRSVVTLAGGSSSGSVAGSVNGQGTSALFNLPGAVGVDALGTLFVADSSNHKIRFFAQGASVATYIGGGMTSQWGVSDGVGSSALFLIPRSTAVGPGGLVYVADSGNHLIRAVYPNRTVVTIAGGLTAGSANGVGASALFNSPSGVAASALGVVYVADAANHKVRIVFPNRTVATLAGGGVSGAQSGSNNGFGAGALFLAPRGVAADASGAVHVADGGNNKIRSVSPSGMVVTLAGGAASGTVAGASDGIGSSALFSQPSAVAVDAVGTVFVADSNNHRIRAIFTNRTVITLAGSVQGSANGLGASALFFIPNGLAVGAHGIVYVADYGNNKIRAVLPNRSVVTVAGGGASGTAGGSADGAAASALFFRVYGVAVDAAGVLYVADETHRVRQVHPPLCPPGAVLPAGALACQPCPPGTASAAPGAASCAQCPGGHACPAGSASWARLNCGLGFYCPEGSAAPLPCPAAVPPAGGWGALRVQGPAFLVETARCLGHCFWNSSASDGGALSTC